MARNTTNGMSINPSRGRNRESNPYGFNRDSFRPDQMNKFETDLRGNGAGQFRSTNPYDRADSEFMDEDELYLAQDYDYRDSERYRDIGKRTETDHSGKGPRGWSRSDERLKEDVSDALFLSYDVDASEVEVEVEKGVVTLSGRVESREMKWAAEDAVDNVSGVIDVRNELSCGKK